MSDMRRREFIALLGGAAAAWPLAVRARQSSDGSPLIGILSPLSAGTATRNIESFRAGLRELGYFEGRNVTLALRFAEGMPERMPALATELVSLKPDVIVAAPETSLLAVRNVTRTIPIITIWLQDPVASGAVESIARPEATRIDQGSDADHRADWRSRKPYRGAGLRHHAPVVGTGARAGIDRNHHHGT